MIGAIDAGLPKQCEGVARGFPFISKNGRHQVFRDGRLVQLADFERARVGIPLHSVAKEMGQQKQALFGGDGVIDMDFGPVEVAGERVGMSRVMTRMP